MCIFVSGLPLYINNKKGPTRLCQFESKKELLKTSFYSLYFLNKVWQNFDFKTSFSTENYDINLSTFQFVIQNFVLGIDKRQEGEKLCFS